MVLPDGREYVYARAGGVALNITKVMQQAVVTSGHETALAPTATHAVGATAITLQNATTALTANMYADGYMFVKTDGQYLKIKSHPAAGATDTCVFTLEDNEALSVALTTASDIGLRKYKTDGVLVAPTTPTGVVVGVTTCEVPINYYCWLLRKGTSSALINGTVIRGLGVTRGLTTAGSVDVVPLNTSDTSGQEQQLGTVETVGGSTEYGLVNFNIQ
jgi:hypothetical protein